MAWVVTFKQDKKDSEYLTEFDCKRATYRQLAHRVFESSSEVVSGDAVYREWFAVPNDSQVVGLLFNRVCLSGEAITHSIERPGPASVDDGPRDGEG
jgi:hypothetical protein